MGEKESDEWSTAVNAVLLGIGGLVTAFLLANSNNNNSSNNNTNLPPPPLGQKPSGCGCNKG